MFGPSFTTGLELKYGTPVVCATFVRRAVEIAGSVQGKVSERCEAVCSVEGVNISGLPHARFIREREHGSGVVCAPGSGSAVKRAAAVQSHACPWKRSISSVEVTQSLEVPVARRTWDQLENSATTKRRYRVACANAVVSARECSPIQVSRRIGDESSAWFSTLAKRVNESVKYFFVPAAIGPRRQFVDRAATRKASYVAVTANRRCAI